MLTQLPETIQNYLLLDAEKRDPVTARRSQVALVLLRERYLSRESLIFRVESMMGFACFGEKSWKDNFYRDMRVVKAALKQADCDLKYCRAGEKAGYYFAGEAPLHPDVKNVALSCLGRVYLTFFLRGFCCISQSNEAVCLAIRIPYVITKETIPLLFYLSKSVSFFFYYTSRILINFSPT